MKTKKLCNCGNEVYPNAGLCRPCSTAKEKEYMNTPEYKINAKKSWSQLAEEINTPWVEDFIRYPQDLAGVQA